MTSANNPVLVAAFMPGDLDPRKGSSMKVLVGFIIQVLERGILGGL